MFVKKSYLGLWGHVPPPLPLPWIRPWQQHFFGTSARLLIEAVTA